MAGTVSKKLDSSEPLKALLREILRRKSVTPLVRQGYTYLRVAELLSAAIGGGLAVEKDGRISLTSEGKKALLGVDKRPKFSWIEPLEDRKVAKIQQMTPYIPERRSLRKVKHRASS